MNKNLMKQKYLEFVMPMLMLSFPNINPIMIEEIVLRSIDKRMKNDKAQMINNYKNKTVDTTIADVTEFILKHEPIITCYGVMFNKHDSGIPNPLIDMLDIFIANRDIDKKLMFKYPKGSEMYNRYNIRQLLDKLDANGLYGTIGSIASIFYNVYIAGSITMEGRNIISTCLLFFESFLCNNIYYKNLNEYIGYLRNIIAEAPQNKYAILDVIDEDKLAKPIDVFYHLIQHSGFGYIPNETDLDILWDIICELDVGTLTRIFYKNNLFAFMENNKPMEMVKDMLRSLNVPFLAPGDVPECIADKLDEFKNILEEFVFYNHPYIDKLELNRHGRKVATILSDTDSVVVNLEPWHQRILEEVENEDMLVKRMIFCPITRLKKNDYGEFIVPNNVYRKHEILHYNHSTDSVESTKGFKPPYKYFEKDALRYSIVNIMSHCLESFVNKTLVELTKHTNSYSPNRKCLIKMKNEYFFKRILAGLIAKSYTSLMELQEGERIPEEESLDLKGFRLKKSTLAKKSRDTMQKILVDEILNSKDIKPKDIINQLMVFEKQIIESINRGETDFLTPVTIKNINTYADPLGLGPVKGAYLWNHMSDIKKIELEMRNSCYNIKVSINKRNIERIKDKFPEEYERLLNIFTSKVDLGLSVGKELKEFNSITIPTNTSIPAWIFEFIDFEEIVSSNIKAFTPILDVLGIESFSRNDVYYSNVLNL